MGLYSLPVVWPEITLRWGNVNLLQKDLCLHTAPRTVEVSTPETVAGHCQRTPPLETPGYSQASLAQSLVGLLLLGPGAHKVSLCPPRVCFPGGSVLLLDLQVGKSVVGPRTFATV